MCSERRVVQEAFKFELDPNRQQRVLLARSVGAARFVYNWGLAESQRCYERTGTRPKLGELKTQLVKLKRTECPWLYEVSAHVGQQALVDLDRAFDRFFKSLKGARPRSGFPRFRKKGERDTARLYEVILEERHIRLPMVGRVRLKETRSERGFDGRILSATIRRRADRWFISLAVQRERQIVLPREAANNTRIVGVDLGLINPAVIHDGSRTRVVEPQKALRKNLVRLKRLDRQLASKQKGSRNREKAKLRRARLHYKVSCQRQDFLHQLSRSLTKTKSVIVLEDLHVRGMQRNRHLALSVSDAGIGELRRQLTYKSEWYGSRLLVADRYYASTQLCSRCGCLNEQLKGFVGLKARRFDCSACGLLLDRDENAAINLRRYGRNALREELGIVPLPEGLREVTPVGEECSGLDAIRVKPTSMKQEASGRRSRGGTRRGMPKGEPARV